MDYVWVLICGFLVMFMQPGFAMLEAGFSRAKNVTNVLMKNLVDYSVGSLAFFAVGFALMMGTSAYLLVGTDGFFLAGEAYDVGTSLTWFFMLVFCATAATIVSGAIAERPKFSVYVIYRVVICTVIYPIYGLWLWGGGWLSSADFMTSLGGGCGALDFAGSGVVHAVGGYVALAGCLLLGPRIGKYTKEGKPIPIPGHSITFAVLGAFILWFGWFGFNPGSTLSAHELRISVIAVNTNLCAAAAAMTAMFITWKKFGKADVVMTVNGAVAGLVVALHCIVLRCTTQWHTAYCIALQKIFSKFFGDCILQGTIDFAVLRKRSWSTVANGGAEGGMPHVLRRGRLCT